MEEICKYILSNIYNKKSTIKFVKMDIQDLLFLENNKNKIYEYFTEKLVIYIKPYSLKKISKKSFNIVGYDNRKIDIIIYNNYWIVTLYPIDDII